MTLTFLHMLLVFLWILGYVHVPIASTILDAPISFPPDRFMWLFDILIVIVMTATLEQLERPWQHIMMGILI